MLTTLLVAAVLAQTAGNNVAPRIGYVYPPGARAGATIDVRLGGYDWTPDMQVFVHDPGVKIEITGPPQGPMHTPPPYWFGKSKADLAQPPVAYEFPARITIAPGVAAGPIRWQVANANGASAISTFEVSDVAEMIEPERNASVIELPAVPAVVSGRISKITEIDQYRFTAAKAGLVVCQLNDHIGQKFSGTLIVRDAAGKIVADAADTVGGGLTVTYSAAAGAVYEASVSDADHAGDRGYVYRLTVEQGPHVTAYSPLVVARGKTTPVQVFGWGVATGAQKLEEATQQVAVPATAQDTFRHEFDTPAGRAVVTLAVGDATDALESTSNDAAARQLIAGTRQTCRFDRLDPASQMAVDRYQITATKGSSFRIAAEAARYQSPVDPTIAVSNAEGKELLRNDDLPGTNDAALTFTAAADGVYTIDVIDLSGTQPSPAHLYRLLVDNAEEAFDFTVEAPEKLDIFVGGTADLVVKSQRVGTWDEPITIKLEGLPEGLVQPETPPPAPEPAPVKGAKPKVKVKKPQPGDIKVGLTAAADVAVAAKSAMIVATATVEGRTVERRAGPVLVALKLKPRVTVKSAVPDGGRVVNRGTTYPADVILERHEDYTGPVTLQQASTQSRQRRGIDGPALVVPAGAIKAKYPVFMPEWLETSQTARMNLIGIVEVPDPKGNKRYVTGAMEGQIVMSMEGGLLKTSHDPQERRVQLGGTIDIPVRVSRTVKLQVPLKVEVMPDPDFPELFESEPVNLPVDQSSALFKIRVANVTQAGRERSVIIRATGLQDGQWPAVSETRVLLVLESRAVATAK